MACFSASKQRVAFEDQYPSKDRARTSRGDRIASGTKSTPKKKCEEIKGYGILELNKQNKRGINQNKTIQPIAPSNQALLQQKEFKRLKSAARVATVDERLDALVKVEQENKRLEEEAERARERFKKMDDERKHAAEATAEKDDLFGTGEKLKVLERSFLAKTEQEEEVKQVNTIILNAKCHAIRDAQVQEKTEIDRQQRDDDIRLEKLVIQNAVKALNEEDEKIERQNENKLKYAQEIRKQLDDHENLRFMEAKRVEQEAKILKKATDAIKRDDERQAIMKRERRNQLRDELLRIAEMSNLFKKMLCEQERELDLRAAAYLQEKDDRDRALLAEKKLEQEQLERKQHRIYTLAQKILESKSKREETAYLREQEKIEREYRRKEKEAVLRKQQIEKEILEARVRQKEENRHRQALQIARAEQDFNVLLDKVKKDESKQKKLDDEIFRRQKCYRSDIIRQMSDKELERRRMLELENNRILMWEESDRQRNENIMAVIKAKMTAMREACLPEKYIKDVEKQLHKIALTRNVINQQQ